MSSRIRRVVMKIGEYTSNNEDIAWKDFITTENNGIKLRSYMKQLIRYEEYQFIDGIKTYKNGTTLRVFEMLDHRFRLEINIPKINKYLSYDLKSADPEYAKAEADDIYRGVITDYMKYFSEDLKMLPDV